MTPKKNRNQIVPLHMALSLIFVALLSSCFWQDEEQQTKDNIRNLKNSTATFVYNMIPPSTGAAISLAYNTAVNTFSVKLLGEIYKSETLQGKNVVFSPFSVSRNLAVITEAAVGTAKQQLLDALGGQAALDDATSALAELLYADRSVILQCADALWFDSTSGSLIPAFKQLANKKYGVEATGLNFTDVPGSVSAINNWISSNTAGRIKNVVEPEHVSPDIRAILTSAIYFEADWTSPFDVNETRPQPFATPGGTVNVDMMSSSYQHAIRKTGDYENVKIFYGSDNKKYFYLDVYMPTAVTLDKFIGEKCMTALGRSDSVEYGPLKMPKFFFENSHDLIPYLRSMGVTAAFDVQQGGITRLLTNKQSGDTLNLYIDYCFQKAGIKTDEEGTVAYAVTVTGGSATMSGGISGITLDKPFVYFIRAGKTGLVLFAGVVNNPNEK